MKPLEFLGTVLFTIMVVMWFIWAFIKADHWCVPLNDHTQRCVMMEIRPK
jgi:hypothetical protein